MTLLVALTKEQKLFQLQREMSHDDLRQLKETNPFFCPQCKEPLLLKIGTIKIPHFAHLKNNACDSFFSEGESAAHLLGKQQLYSLFTRLQLPTVVEPYLPQIQQRPDLLVTKDDEQYAIEFQCSKIAGPLFQNRTNGYQAVNINPVWLLHTPNAHFKTVGITKISINHTNAQFIQTYKKQHYLLTYDVQREMFYYVSNLIPIQGLQYFGVIQELPLTQQNFPFFIPKVMSKQTFQMIFTKVLMIRNTTLRSRLFLSKKGVNDSFLRAIYEMQCTIFKLPHFIGIPVECSVPLPVPNVEWQLLLFYFLQCHELTPQSMHLKSIPYFLKWAKLDEGKQMVQAVDNYLELLKKLAIENVHSDILEERLINLLYDELVAFD